MRAKRKSPVAVAVLTEETLVALQSKKPSVPIPSLSDPSPEIYIVFEDVGQEVFSDIPGGFTFAKRIAMAYASVTRTGSSFAGIAGNILTAFAIVGAEKTGKHLKIFVRLNNGAEKVSLPCADPKFMETLKDRSNLGTPHANHRVEAIKYGLLRKMHRYGDCPNCGHYIGSHELSWQDTDMGKRRIATCACGTMVRGYYD